MSERIEKLADSLWLNEILHKYSVSETGKYGVCDANMKIILPVIFDEIEMSSDKQIVGKINGKLYYFKVEFIDNKTKAEITSAFYVDTNGQITEDEELFYLDRLCEMSENLWKMYSSETKKFGVIDSLGNIILPFEYSGIFVAEKDEQYGYIVAGKDDKCGMFDKKGNMVIPVMYEYLNMFAKNLLLAKLNGKYGFIDIHNEVKIPFIYDNTGWIGDEEAEMELNGETVCINKKGNIIV